MRLYYGTHSIGWASQYMACITYNNNIDNNVIYNVIINSHTMWPTG